MDDAGDGGGEPQLKHDPEKWYPVSHLREAPAQSPCWLDASAREGRSDQIMLKDYVWRLLLRQIARSD